MRDVTVLRHPIIEPGVCGKCGTQNSSWFVDLGFDTIFNYENDAGMVTWCDGVVYLCAECTNSFMHDLFRAYNIFKRAEEGHVSDLKMVPITLGVKEEEDGDSGRSNDDDSGDPEDADSDIAGDESDDADDSDDGADSTPPFRISIAETV